ncbi:MAG: tetratricopeptide repeat protein [Phycisphaera sp.]|nr:tetratricopeptide repeat protein [Phycisphaera sp.]
MNEWQNAEQLAQQALKLYEAGQWLGALEAIQQALSVQPDQDDWHFGMGLTLEALGRFDEAAASFARALELRGDDVDLMLHQATSLIQAGKPRPALDVLQRVKDLDPQCEAGYCYSIAAHSLLGEHQEAETNFYLARQVEEWCPRCLDHIAQSLAMRGRFDRAVWCWQKALELDDQYPGTHLNLARTHWHSGMADTALDDYHAHLRSEPGDTEALLEVGRLLFEMRRFAEAGEKYRRVLELEPACAQAHAALGELAFECGHMREAIARLHTASRLDPQAVGVQYWLARVSQATGKSHAALRHAQRELDRHNRPIPLSIDLARLLYELDQPELAINVLTPLLDVPTTTQPDAVTLSPDELASALLCRGAARMRTHQTEAGVEDCRRVLRHRPRDVTAMVNLALAYLQLQRYARARFWIIRAREVRPDDPQLRALHGRLIRVRFMAWVKNALKRVTGGR